MFAIWNHILFLMTDFNLYHFVHLRIYLSVNPFGFITSEFLLHFNCFHSLSTANRVSLLLKNMLYWNYWMTGLIYLLDNEFIHLIVCLVIFWFTYASLFLYFFPANNDQCNFKHQLNSIMPVAPANRVASGPLLTTHYVVSQLQCMDYCARNVHCYAFNYEIEPRNVKRRRCELLSGIDGLEHRQRYTHQIMDHERFRDVSVGRSVVYKSGDDSQVF